MKIMILEADLEEQLQIANMLKSESVEIHYETTVPRAINALGLVHVDLALIDADQADKKNKICDWKDLIAFLQAVNIEFTVFSSNGKVGVKDGLEIISINDIPELIASFKCLEVKGV